MDEGKIIVKNATIIDGNGKEPFVGDMVVKGGMIIDISEKASGDYSDYEVIDGAKRYLLPGLIDCHVHYGGTESPKDQDWVMENDLQQAIISTAQCMKSLLHGFTTVRDISNNGIHLRNVINMGIINGPRIVACGRGLSRTGGHADSYTVPIEIVKESHPWGMIADGPEEVRKSVRTLLRQGVDCIKVWASGGGLWAWERETDQHYSYEELKMMVDEASYYGLPVCSHAECAEAALDSARAGVASIEHGEELTEECLEIMKEKDITLVPTIGLFFEWFSEYDPPIRKSQDNFEGITRSEKELNRITANFQAARNKGVRIAVGADSFCDTLTPYGAYALKEIYTMVQAGMPEIEAITCATRNGAELLRVIDSTGTLEQGKSADFIVLDGNPLENIMDLNKDNMVAIVKCGNFVVKKV